VWFEELADVREAIQREKTLKQSRLEDQPDRAHQSALA
jgi:predicted GIY-YIG superfamily endonuclease